MNTTISNFLECSLPLSWLIACVLIVVCFIVISLLYFCVHSVNFIEIEMIIIIGFYFNFDLIRVDLSAICSRHCLTHSSWTMSANISHGSWPLDKGLLNELRLPYLAMSPFCRENFHRLFSYTT